MGFFGNLFQGMAKDSEEESPAALRKQHGFADFDSEMERLRSYAPAAEQASTAPRKAHEKLAEPIYGSHRRGRQ